MGKSTGLSAKQERFVAEYLVDLNSTQAAIRAGYAAKNADVTGPRLLGNVGIAAAIAERTAKQLDKADLSAVRVLEEYRRLSFADPRKLFDADGNLIPIHKLDAETAATIASFEVIKKNAAAGDGLVDVVHKIRTVDKTKALDSLAKHFGLLVERLEHGGQIVIKHELPE